MKRKKENEKIWRLSCTADRQKQSVFKINDQKYEITGKGLIFYISCNKMK